MQKIKNSATSLLYHDIIDSNGFDSSGFNGDGANKYKLNKSKFEAQVKVLASAEICTTSLENIMNWKSQNNFFMTFDDGGKSFLEIATILEKYNMIGCFFISTSFINKKGFLRDKEILELHNRGHIIGSHSHTHPNKISDLSNHEISQEWEKSIATLENIIGENILFASVPGGFTSLDIIDTASSFGIRYLFTSEPIKSIYKFNHMYIVGRYMIDRETPLDNIIPLAQSYINFIKLKQYLLWNMKKILKKVFGRYYIGMRKNILSKVKSKEFK